MNKTFALIFSFLLTGIGAKSNDNYEADSTYVSRLTPRESRVIRNLVRTDTLSIPSHTNLQIELFKYDANLLYKYRLDSIKTAIPLDYNPYVQTFIDAFLTKGKSQIGKMISRGNYYFPIFENALNAYKIPDEFKYLPIVESAMDPLAVSKSGATGLWQFMYTTGIGYGLNINNYVDERRDPIQSSYAAAKYLKEAYANLGDWLLALASYNCGQGAVSRAIIRAGGGSKTFWEIQEYLPMETRNYVPKFIAVTYMMHYYNRYKDIEIPDANFKRSIDSIYINKFVSFNNLADVLNIESKEIEILNPSYKKNLINGSPEAPKRLIIPKVDHKTYASLFDILNSDENNSITYASLKTEEPKLYVKKRRHTVLKGENLTTIANQYKVEVQDIKVWNSLRNLAVLPGQKLIISDPNHQNHVTQTNKAPKYITYTVKLGDTLSSIAKRFNGVSVGSIQELNNLSNYTLKAGMILMINALQ